MKPLFLVAIGGALGSVARYLVSVWLLHHTTAWRFPAGTFAVNILGCLAAGILAGLIARHELFSADTRLFLFTGILGGFTTFSAFGLETFFLLRRGELMVASANIVLSVVAGLFALWLGFGAIASRNT